MKSYYFNYKGISGTLFFLLCLPLWCGPSDELLRPFEGFSDEGLRPVYELFRADPEGRNLLRNSWRKLKFTGAKQLKDVLCYCDETQLAGHPDRRGLFMQETAYYFRRKGEPEWRSETQGGLERLKDRRRFPILDEQESRTTFFEYRKVVFRPKVCIKRGMNLLQTYLVLYHELSHLAGLDPFDELDLFSFDDATKEQHFYYQQLTKPGGELDAYLAQVAAFKRLRERYEFPEKLVLESFLTEGGRLLYRDRPAFLGHLLDQGNYRATLDSYLGQQVYFQYNRAHSWWDFYSQMLTGLDDQLAQIETFIERTRQHAKDSAGNRANRDVYLDRQAKWEGERLKNRKLHNRYLQAQRQYIELMEKIDRSFPR